jgi:hypothetical protein
MEENKVISYISEFTGQEINMVVDNERFKNVHLVQRKIYRPGHIPSVKPFPSWVTSFESAEWLAELEEESEASLSLSLIE